MKVKWKFCAEILAAFTFTFFYCEFFIYYLVINQCSWPESQDKNDSSMLKVLLLADTHLLGPFRGHWFDKLRREWQMYRCFQTAISLHQPNVVFLLGDLFDEGQWCNEKEFQNYVSRFYSLFRVPSNIQMYVVPGNHDLGFHYALRPALLQQFERCFNSSSVQFLNIEGNYFILINSMAMEGDGCYLCYDAEKKLRKIASELKCMKDGTCLNMKNFKYSRPIVLQHFPMYRESDAKCSETDEAPSDVKNVLFREKWDCLSKKASEMIYNILNPRVIFTGHVHHGCHTIHRGDIHEYTLPSFSWRNKNNPTFTLAKFSQNFYITKKCDLPRESTVIFIYASVVFGSIIWKMYLLKKEYKSKRK